MKSVAQIHSQGKPFMPLTPQERVRKQVAGELVPKIAELLYQCDKGSPHAKLSDLKTEEARAAYLADALMITDVDARFERVQRVHLADANHYARQDHEAETAASRGRKDVATYAPVRRGNFGVVPAGLCYLCTTPIQPDMAAVLELSATLKVDVHGECCLHDPKLEMTAQFAFRVKGGKS